MKKILKKFWILVFTSMIFAQVALPVMAQPNLSGIDPNREGSITINRFAGSTASAPTSGTPLNGIPYTIQLVRLRSDIDTATADLRYPGNFEPIPEGEGGFSATQSTVNGIASFTNLPQGIFLITEGTHTVTPEADRIAPFIVGIPRRVIQDDEEIWVYDVNVYPKSEEDTIVNFDKTFSMGWDEVAENLVANWELQTVVPRLIGNATRFEFSDPLDDRLTLIPNSIVGTYLRTEDVDGTLTQVEAILPSSAFDYDVNGDNVLTISLTQSGFDHLSANALIAPEGTLIFTFRTTVSMLEADLGSISNAATLYYNNNDGVDATAAPLTQFAMEIEKIDVNGTRLSEATFEVFLDAAGNEPAFPISGGNLSFRTINGVAFIPGLQAGTFYLQETEAPDGFRLIADNMRVVVDEVHADGTRDYVVLLQVVNEVEGGFYLPVTGGVGTIIFTVVGVILLGSAVSLAMVAKRRREQHD